MEEISVTCDPTSPELKIAVGRVFREKRRDKIITFSIIFLLLSILLFSTGPFVNLVLGFICVGFAVLMPLVHLISAAAAVRDTERQGFTVVLGEREISFKSRYEFVTELASCEAFEDETVITLLAENSQVYCIPKRCFESQEKYARFVAFLSENLADRYIKK